MAKRTSASIQIPPPATLAEAQAGTETEARHFSPLRVADAIAALETPPVGGAPPGWELVATAIGPVVGGSLTATVPANTLDADGQHLYVEAYYEASVVTQQPRLSFDGQQLSGGSLIVSSTERAYFTSRITREGAAAQRIDTVGQTSLGSNAYAPSQRTDTADLTTAIDIVADFTVAGTNICRWLKVWKVSE